MLSNKKKKERSGVERDISGEQLKVTLTRNFLIQNSISIDYLNAFLQRRRQVSDDKNTMAFAKTSYYLTDYFLLNCKQLNFATFTELYPLYQQILKPYQKNKDFCWLAVRLDKKRIEKIGAAEIDFCLIPLEGYTHDPFSIDYLKALLKRREKKQFPAESALIRSIIFKLTEAFITEYNKPASLVSEAKQDEFIDVYFNLFDVYKKRTPDEKALEKKFENIICERIYQTTINGLQRNGKGKCKNQYKSSFLDEDYLHWFLLSRDELLAIDDETGPPLQAEIDAAKTVSMELANNFYSHYQRLSDVEKQRLPSTILKLIQDVRNPYKLDNNDYSSSNIVNPANIKWLHCPFTDKQPINTIHNEGDDAGLSVSHLQFIL